ncbi:MAG: multiheme c-type cytochrome [Thermoguttaceae bacterium]
MPTREAKTSPGSTKAEQSGRQPFDPIKENGLFFEGWPRPRLALVLTGRQDGYLEPCGCAGLDRMKGGIGRRFMMLDELRRTRGWPVVAVDVGGQVKGYGKQTELKFQITVQALKKMGYDAVALGRNDLKLPALEVAAHAAGVGGAESIFVSANVNLFDLIPRQRVIDRGGLRLGITSILGAKYQKELHNPELELFDPEVALGQVLAELKRDKCDLLILLAHASMEESVALAERFPELDVVVTAGGPPEPPADRPQTIGRKTLLVEVGEKGMAAVVLGFYDDPNQPVRYQRVLLDSRYPPSAAMQSLMQDYQSALETLGLAGLNVRPMPNPRLAVQGTYVGSEKCESCHEQSFRIWKKSGHAKAYQTLLKLDPKRNFDPECIACHVIGWDPAQFTPYEGGYWDLAQTPHLVHVGCESCHGPGEAHCNAELRNDPALQKKLQQAMVLTKAEAEKHFCATCHDLDNSPDFQFEAYWPKIEHYEDQ